MDSLLPSLFAVAVAERSFEEVAYETGCPIGTLKSRVHRARLHCVDDEQQLAV
jgi:DNA-directed RNA polymerase specialized sigma24 family protein